MIDTSLVTRSVLREVLLVFVLVCLGTALLNALPDVAVLREVSAIGTALLFLWTALEMSARQPSGLLRFCVTLDGFLEPPSAIVRDFLRRGKNKRERTNHGPVPPSRSMRAADRAPSSEMHSPLRSALSEVGFAVNVASITFPPFVLCFYAFQNPVHAFHLSLPSDFISFALGHYLVTAIPEEAFFRGYTQSRLGEAFAQRITILGARICPPALLLQGLLFAVVHLVTDLSPARLAVFFPGLLFGWMREKRSGIGAAAVYHALCNILSELLFRGWF